MTQFTHDQAKLAYDYIKTRVLNKTTGLLYDHAHANDMNHFPTPEEVAAAYPNPCGYSVGMEDGMINGGTMLDACLLKYESEKTPESLELAHALAKGMLDCLLHTRSEGYVPRGVIPADRKSCYVDSSIDQYTMFCFGLFRLLESGYADEKEKERIKCALLSVAKRAENNLTEENDYDLLRDDGGKSLVSRIWGETRGNHEVHRLPMRYIFAYHLSGNTHFLELYKSIREKAYEKSLTFGGYWHLYCLQQMQASVYICMKLDNDDGWKEKYLYLMNKAADYAESCIPSVTSEINSHSNYNAEYLPFRECARDLRAQNKFAALGFPDAFHPQREDEHEFFTLQDAANAGIIEGMVPGRSPSKKSAELFELGFSKIDFSKHERCVPIHYVDAYYRLLQS